jgi:DNA-binding transcriptional LysR family regulator
MPKRKKSAGLKRERRPRGLKPSLDALALFRRAADEIEGSQCTSLNDLAEKVKRTWPYLKQTIDTLQKQTGAHALIAHKPLRLTAEGKALRHLATRMLDAHDSITRGLVDEVVMGGVNAVGRQVYSAMVARSLTEPVAWRLRFKEMPDAQTMAHELTAGSVDFAVATSNFKDFDPDLLEYEDIQVALETVLLVPPGHPFRGDSDSGSERPIIEIADLASQVVCITAADAHQVFAKQSMQGRGGRVVVADNYSTLVSILRQAVSRKARPVPVAVVGTVGDGLLTSEGLNKEGYLLCTLAGMAEWKRSENLGVYTMKSLGDEEPVPDPTQDPPASAVADPTQRPPASPVTTFLETLREVAQEIRGPREREPEALPPSG